MSASWCAAKPCPPDQLAALQLARLTKRFAEITLILWHLEKVLGLTLIFQTKLADFGLDSDQERAKHGIQLELSAPYPLFPLVEG
jgi:hypothetical protein